MRMTRFVFPFITLLTINLATQSFSLGDISYAQMGEYLENLGLGGECTAESYQRMRDMLINTLSQIQDVSCEAEQQTCQKGKIVDCTFQFPHEWCVQLLQNEEDDGFSKPLRKNFVAILKYGIAQLEKHKSSETQEQAFVFMLAKNILYNIFSVPFKTRKMTFEEIVTFPAKLTSKLRYRGEKDRREPITLEDAKKEAKFLVDPESAQPDRFLTPSELVGKTHEELAALDVREDHHIWHSERYMKEHPRLWDDFMKMMQTLIEQNLDERNDVETPYDLDLMRQVVWLERFQDSAGVHPKLRVRDVHGFKWKLKFGSEFFSEQLANFLYLSLGGKYNDLNFSHTVANPVYVVLQEKPVEQMQQNRKTQLACVTIATPDDLQQCLDKKSKKPIKISQYVLPGNVGVIDDSNLAAFMKDSHMKEKDLLGRHYIALHQVSMEFRDKRILKRTGPAPHSTMGNEDDRAMRGMILFHFWVDNFDVKDDNGEGALMPTPYGPRQLIQAPTDLGGAFRGSLGHGTGVLGNGIGINHYNEKDWLFVPALDRRHLLYPRLMTFFPDSAKKARFSDTLWMAKKIVGLPFDTIKRGVDMTPLPDFYKDLLLYKLAKRRADLAKLYGIEDLLDVSTLKIPEHKVSFGCPGCDEEIAERYHIPVSLIAAERKKLGIDGKQWIESVVRKGRLEKCNTSLLINLLERYAYPDGLSRNHLIVFEKPGVCRFHL
ncbi:MAG: hypothetical protein HYW48_07960 [Deltaproteobacteria bacterium]|nr:hypothetical protein [Deltaproteobacteria bacterium]